MPLTTSDAVRPPPAHARPVKLEREPSRGPDPRPAPKLDKPAPTPAPAPAPAADGDSPAADDNPDDDDEPPKQLETIDMETFQQILELDEDDTLEFSRGMAWAYFSQADSTFDEMDEALSTKDLPRLSSLGHFLKGSSAALGVSKVQASCEKIQHYGQLRDEEAAVDLTDAQALGMIDKLLVQVKEEYRVAEAWLRNWYDEAEEKAKP